MPDFVRSLPVRGEVRFLNEAASGPNAGRKLSAAHSAQKLYTTRTPNRDAMLLLDSIMALNGMRMDVPRRNLFEPRGPEGECAFEYSGRAGDVFDQWGRQMETSATVAVERKGDSFLAVVRPEWRAHGRGIGPGPAPALGRAIWDAAVSLQGLSPNMAASLDPDGLVSLQFPAAKKENSQ